ncbi:hypothetical protein [Pseudoxanthomonas jiangsuensis]|uniref:hypothetical protein n=1 Tax=Pseudoxanthomonas jiangsuensis TaxID=619688 RepID=UPI0013910B5B|nr:hypothetical protein [Pseudoxanthomonas jiangsuensis]
MTEDSRRPDQKRAGGKPPDPAPPSVQNVTAGGDYTAWIVGFVNIDPALLDDLWSEGRAGYQ